ncbi:hypothetical protein H0H81_008995, partial [Sphagnurus paluster]
PKTINPAVLGLSFPPVRQLMGPVRLQMMQAELNASLAPTMGLTANINPRYVRILRLGMEGDSCINLASLNRNTLHTIYKPWNWPMKPVYNQPAFEKRRGGTERETTLRIA